MPTYACSITAGCLTPAQRHEIARSLTAIHAEETGAPAYLVQMIFQDVQLHSHYIGGEAAPVGRIWIRGDIRAGRTDAVKQRMIERMLHDTCETAGFPEEQVWIYICDVPAQGIAEYGRILPEPGAEAAWEARLPESLRERLLAPGRRP
jgi:phenylpyruvate tautomerase PptA (4-oxalocrotonate tautomerase family)